MCIPWQEPHCMMILPQVKSGDHTAVGASGLKCSGRPIESPYLFITINIEVLDHIEQIQVQNMAFQ